MGKNRIALILMSAGLLSGGTLLTQSTFNKPVKNNTSNVRLLADINNAGYGCVINGNGNLSITNLKGEVVGYVSVGQMLKLGSNDGQSTFVTVEETGVTGYINNLNIKNITSGISDPIARMNRKGTVINVSTDVHLRQEATMNSGIVANLTNGTNLTITGKQGNWYRVSVNGIKGYVFGEYIGEGNSVNGGVVSVNSGITYTSPSNGNRIIVNGNTPVEHHENVVNHNDNKTAPTVNNDNGETPVSNHFQHLINGNNPQPVVNHETTPDKVTPEKGKQLTPQQNNNQPIHVGGKVENPNPQITPGEVIPTPNKVQPEKATPNKTEPSKVTPEKVTPNKTEPEKASPSKVIPEHHDNKVTPNKTEPEKVVPEHKTAPNKVEPNKTEPSKVTPEHHDNKNTPNNVTPGKTSPNGVDTPNKIKRVEPQNHNNEDAPAPKVIKRKLPDGGVKTTPDKVVNRTEPHNDVNTTPNKDQNQPIHDGSVNKPNQVDTPNTINKDNVNRTQTQTKAPEHKTVVEPAPVIKANNVTINVNHKFNDSMIDAQATVDGQPVKTTITGSVNTKVPGTYDLTVTATNSQGESSSKVVKVTVHDVAPTLIARNYTMTVGASFNVSDLVEQATSAEGQNLASQVKIVDSQYSLTTPGVYTITIQVTDNYGETSTATATLTVKAPQLTISPAKPITIKVGQQIQMSEFDGMTNQPNCTYKIIGNYDINKIGTYIVKLQATDQYGTTAETFLEIIVKPNSNAPKIHAQSITIIQGQPFYESMLNIYENEKNCTTTCTTNVNINKPGVYYAYIVSTNPEGQSSNITVTITVKAKPKQEQGFQWVDQNAGIGRYSGPIQEPGQTIQVSNVEVYEPASEAAQQIVNQALFNDINQFREANGLKAFIWNGDLYTMAHWKSNDCNVHDYFTHKDLQGQYTNQVFANQYKWGSWCENLAGAGGQVENAEGTSFMTRNQLENCAEQIFQAWKASPGHRANMLSNNTYGAVSVIMGDKSVYGEDGGIATMEAANYSTKQVFNIQTLQSKTEEVPAPSHFTTPGPNVFIAKENANTNHHEIKAKSNTQTLNTITNNKVKNPNRFSINLEPSNN